MKYQFIILTNWLPMLLDVYKKTGGYLEVISCNDIEFTTVISDNPEFLYHDDFKSWPRTPVPFLKQDESEFQELKALIEKSALDREPGDVMKWDKVEIETTTYLDPPVEGKAVRAINTLDTSIKVGGEELYREILSNQEYASDKSFLRQFEQFLVDLKFARMIKAHPGEPLVLSKKTKTTERRFLENRAPKVVNIQFTDLSDNRRERIVTVNGEEYFRDKNTMEAYGELNDPLRKLELWLFDMELRRVNL